MNKKALLLIIPFAAAGLAGCERANPNPPGPTPDPQCESATVNIKSAGDVTTIKPGQTLQLTAEVNISGCTFSWGTSDSAIATVDANGLVTGVKAGDVVINYGSGSFNLKVDDDAPTPPVVSGLKEAYEAGFAKTSGATDPMTFSATVVAIRSCSGEYFIQDGEYGIDLYHPAEADVPKLVIGKKVKVTAALCNYKGLVETSGDITVEADGDGVVPQPANVASKAALDALKTNVLANAEGVVVKKEVNTKNNDTTLTIAIAGENVPVFFKGGIINDYTTFLNAATEGVSVVLNKVVVGDREGRQLIVVDGSELTAGEPTPTKEVKSLAIAGTATKTVYVEGEAYSAAGLSVVATYTDDTTETVTVAITPSKAKAALGDTSVTFSATFGGQTATKSVDVTVNEKPAPTGESSIYTFTNDKTEAQNMKDWTSEQFMQHVVLDGSEVITGIKDITNAYIGANGGSNETAWNIWNCLKVGKSGAAGTATLTLDSSVLFESIKVSAIGNRDDGTLTINGVTKDVTKKAVKGDLEPMELEFDIAGGISELVISSKEATSGNYGISITKIEFVGGGTPVEPSVEKVELDKSTLNLQPEGSAKLTATVSVKGGAAQTVTWSSDNEAIATVDNDGTVHAVAVGDANITATSTVDSGKHASCAVSVTEAPVDVLETISASGYTNEVEKDATYEFDGKVYGHYSVSGDVELNSADWSVTTPINTSEVGAKVGIITYSKDDVVKTCEFNVTVKAPKPAPAEVDVSYSFAAVKDSSGKQYTSETLKADFTAGLSKGDDIINTVVPTVIFGAAGSLKPGNKTGGGSIEINTTKNIVGVVVTAKDYGTDGSSISVAGEESALTADSAEYAASFAACKSVTISTTKRAYIEAIGFVLEGSTPVTPAVNGVTVSPKTANLDLTETTSVTLSATVVAVGGASEDVVWSIESGDDYVSLPEIKTGSSIVVTAAAEGTAVIKVASEFDPTKYDTCEVTVSETPAPQPELDSISVDASNAKTEYTEGETVVKDGLVVTAHYTNGGEDKVLQAAEYSVSPSGALTIEDDTVTVTYEGKTDTYAITVSEQTAEKGTLENPFTAEEAKTEALKLEETTSTSSPKPSEKAYYIKGRVSKLAKAFDSFMNYSFWLDDAFEGWQLFNGPDKEKFNDGDIMPGDEVIIYGKLLNFKGTPENATDAYVYSVKKGTVQVSIDEASSKDAQVTLTGGTTALNGSSYSFDVVVNEGYELVSVKVNGVDAVKGQGNSYSISVNGPVKIIVTTKEAGQKDPIAYDNVSLAASGASKGCQNYTTTDVKYTGSKVNIVADKFNNDNKNASWDYIRAGIKNATSTATLKTESSISAEIVSVEIDIGQLIRGSCTGTLYVANNSSFTGADEYTFSVSDAGVITINITNAMENAYYKIDFVCVNTTNSNGVINVKSVAFNYIPE